MNKVLRRFALLLAFLVGWSSSVFASAINSYYPGLSFTAPTTFAESSALFVNVTTTGTLTVVDRDGKTVSFVLPVGAIILPIRVVQVTAMPAGSVTVLF